MTNPKKYKISFYSKEIIENLLSMKENEKIYLNLKQRIIS